MHQLNCCFNASSVIASPWRSILCKWHTHFEHLPLFFKSSTDKVPKIEIQISRTHSGRYLELVFEVPNTYSGRDLNLFTSSSSRNNGGAIVRSNVCSFRSEKDDPRLGVNRIAHLEGSLV